MDYEKPQRGNPYQLTIKPHCFPAKSISRFIKDNDCVDVYLISHNKTIQAKPENELFCAKRSWDQRVEETFMKSIEDDYQELAEKVVSEKVISINTEQQRIITRMYLLWNIRWHWSYQTIGKTNLEGVKPICDITKDKQEYLEKNHISFIAPDSTIPARFIKSIKIQQNIDMEFCRMQYTRWGIIKSKEEEFLVPDNSSRQMLLPLTPKMCFLSESDNDTIDDVKLAEINRISANYSYKYYFARDLSRCPK